MLKFLNWETLQSCRFNMCLCIIYKAHYSLTMFLLLGYTTPATFQTWGNNIKFILWHCSKDVFKHNFLPITLRGWNTLPHGQWRLHSWTCSRPASQVLHTNVTLNCLSYTKWFIFVKYTFFLIIFLFCPSRLILSIDGS